MNCQILGCDLDAVSVAEIELPEAWEATANFTVMTVHAGCCYRHGIEVARRVEAILEARNDLHNLITILEAAVLAEADRKVGGAA
jgi:hypothetical protein